MSESNFSPVPPPPPAPDSGQDTSKGKRRWLIPTVVGVLAFLAGLLVAQDGKPETAAADSASSTASEASAEESPSEAPDVDPAPPPPPAAAAPDPRGTTSGHCDYLLDFDTSHSFVATVEVTNTGNIGLTLNVWVTFSQIGADPIRYEQTVDVPVGETVAVNFDEDATTDQIDRHQSSDSECDLGGDVIGTVGEVVDL